MEHQGVSNYLADANLTKGSVLGHKSRCYSNLTKASTLDANQDTNLTKDSVMDSNQDAKLTKACLLDNNQRGLYL